MLLFYILPNFVDQQIKENNPLQIKMLFSFHSNVFTNC
jgi:hypothetical protein